MQQKCVNSSTVLLAAAYVNRWVSSSVRNALLQECSIETLADLERKMSRWSV